MRPPTMLAKAAASLDVMSGGRFELGIGAGTFWDAVAGMGGPRRESGERGAALEEAIDLIRAALDVGTERGVVRGAGPYLPGARLPRRPASGPSRGDLGGRHGAARAGAHRAKGRRLGPRWWDIPHRYVLRPGCPDRRRRRCCRPRSAGHPADRERIRQHHGRADWRRPPRRPGGAVDRQADSVGCRSTGSTPSSSGRPTPEQA